MISKYPVKLILIMVVVVLKKRNIRILIITILLLGLTLTVLKSTTTSVTPTFNSVTDDSDSIIHEINDYNSNDAKQINVPINNDINDISVQESSNNKEAAIKQDQMIEQQQQQQQEIEPLNVSAIDIEKEYAEILNLGPIIMFSKTYCPYSHKLKNLLSDHFEFDPPIIFIELDRHQKGAELQEYIGRVTGRTTVPNLMINGESRGGFDDINKLFNSETLYDSLVKWCDNKLTVRKRLVPLSQK